MTTTGIVPRTSSSSAVVRASKFGAVITEHAATAVAIAKGDVGFTTRVFPGTGKLGEDPGSVHARPLFG